MIQAIILAVALSGEPQPALNLILAGHSGDWQFKRLITDVRHDHWIVCRFKIWQVERDISSPQWSTSRSTWNKWPTSPAYPKGPFCTSGFATMLLRKELARHMEEMRDEHNRVADCWMENRQLDSKYHEPFLNEAERFRAPVPAEAPDGG